MLLTYSYCNQVCFELKGALVVMGGSLLIGHYPGMGGLLGIELSKLI